MKVFVLLLIVASCAVSFDIINPPNGNTIFNPDLFEGDITAIAGHLPGEEGRVAKLDDKYLWPNGVVPYTFGYQYQNWEKERILKGLADIQKKTCITFKERTNEDDYVEISSIQGKGCSSPVGRMGGKQTMTLQSTSCVYVGLVVHEFMHAIGFFHEHTRYDRDEYVTVVKQNIYTGSWFNFAKRPKDETRPATEEYNYYSIMHYGSYAAAIDTTRQSIIPKESNVVLEPIWKKTGLTEKDANQIKALYKCK